MPTTKRIEFEFIPGSSMELFILDGDNAQLLDNTDGVFRAAPAQLKIPVPEHTIANGFFYDLPGTFVLLESRSDWGTRNVTWKANQVSSTIVERSGSMSIVSDAAAPEPATVTDIAICNNAILLLGGTVITAFDDGSAEANLCNALWYPTVDALMRLHPWNCAIKRATLTPDETAPVYEWTAAFTLPADLLRILDLDGVTDYKVEGRKILCDESTLNIRYIYRSAASTWDTLLVEAMTAFMSFKLAYPLTKSNATREAQWKVFTEVLRSAKAIDAQEEPGDTLGDFPFINVRR